MEKVLAFGCHPDDVEFMSAGTLALLAEKGFDPLFGARPVKRLIQKEIVNELSKAVIAGTIDRDKTVKIDVRGGELVMTNV